MIDPSVLVTETYKMIKEEYEAAIYAGPTYICNACWKFECRQSVCKFNSENCDPKKSKWICKSCHKSILNKSIPMQAQANNLSKCQKYNELESLWPSELMLISKIIPFIFTVAWHEDAQHGLKVVCVLVPADLKKKIRKYIQDLLVRSI